MILMDLCSWWGILAYQQGGYAASTGTLSARRWTALSLLWKYMQSFIIIRRIGSYMENETMLQIQEETGPSIIFLASVWMRLEPSITRILPWSWLCTALFPRMSSAVMLRSFLALALKQFLISTDDDSTAGSKPPIRLPPSQRV